MRVCIDRREFEERWPELPGWPDLPRHDDAICTEMSATAEDRVYNYSGSPLANPRSFSRYSHQPQQFEAEFTVPYEDGGYVTVSLLGQEGSSRWFVRSVSFERCSSDEWHGFRDTPSVEALPPLRSREERRRPPSAGTEGEELERALMKLEAR